MTWINLFSTAKIPFYIYKLQPGDSLINISGNDQNQSMLVLHGIMYMLQVFTNNETLPIAILHSNSIIDIHKTLFNNKSYYKIIAVEETYIISFKQKDLIHKHKKTKNTLVHLLYSYKLTLYNNEIMRQILAHKYIKSRIIQLILFLSIEFGIIENKTTRIPFIIRKTDIAIITGTNLITTNKIINQLKKKKIIDYSKQKIITINNYFLSNCLFIN
uniref:Global nitrogen transcriptional regulator n=1 Tax=Pterothamnion crispum TaxID=1550583 RepID=A0A4D6WXE3_9FLOR|nr:global nitrogen transcriptional regulator [Pterothamnion crispum]